MNLMSLIGYFDEVVNWPTSKVKIDVNLIDQCEMIYTCYSGDWSWDRPTEKEKLMGIMTNSLFRGTVRVNLRNFLKNGALFFLCAFF